jgi:phosphoribosylglycinamide formyltransferase-1
VGRLRVGILISGRGSNMRALIEACADGSFPAEIVLVLSSDPAAAGLAHATEAGVVARALPHRDYADRTAFDAALDRELRAARVDLVCLAGFMRLLTDGFVEAWRDRMINIHPSLLPAYPGLDTHGRVLADGGRFTGCTVHFVRPEMDTGPIIAQAVVPVRPDDSPDSLAARVLAQEHRLYPFALRLVAEGRVRVAGERAIIDGASAPETTLVNPAP